ncbi:hypothetical protein, partial [Hyphomonas sp.]|uniref:hypothetical protein n=1 Tax=Hyphomonas sp. TaxID=87 RepID=UPI0025BDF9FF
MVNTLRRKMFKLGGSANTHGVGITSGLKMKKGGTVHVGVGSGNQPKKMGPDGQMRDAHAFQILPFLGSAAFMGGRSALGLGRLLGRRGLKGLKRFFTPTRTGRVERTVQPSPIQLGRRGSPGNIGGTMARDPFTRQARTLTGMDRARFAGKIIGAPVGALGAVGGISALAPRIEDPERIATKALEGARGLTEGAFNIAAGVPGTLLQIGRSPEDLQGAAGLIRSTLYGETKAPVPGSEDESEMTKEIKTQASQFEGLSEKAEALAKEIRRDNNLAVLSKAALDFGAAAQSGADLAESLQAGTVGVFDELGRRRDLTENIAGQLATQIFADEATQSAMIAEAAKTGDPAAVNRMQKYFDAYNEGVT